MPATKKHRTVRKDAQGIRVIVQPSLAPDGPINHRAAIRLALNLLRYDASEAVGSDPEHRVR